MTINSWIVVLMFFCTSHDVEEGGIGPPGTVKISDNFYADRREVSNMDYREYLYWMVRIFGKDSQKYIDAIPDIGVWDESDLPNAEYLKNNYLFDYHFDDFPVVGVSWEQALEYLKWRSDRVYEMILIESGMIMKNLNQNSESYFTIQKYKNGEYLNYKPKELHPFAYFSLPSEEEWEVLANAENDLKTYPYGIKKDKNKLENKKGCKFFNTLCKRKLESIKQKSKKPITVDGTRFKSNHFHLYNTIGNVCEMTNEKGLAKGGSWMHDLKECTIVNSFTYESPSSWLGFRAVCRWVEID